MGNHSKERGGAERLQKRRFRDGGGQDDVILVRMRNPR